MYVIGTPPGARGSSRRARKGTGSACTLGARNGQRQAKHNENTTSTNSNYHSLSLSMYINK